jgi:tetratricopeptide (TPR) repeat protein
MSRRKIAAVGIGTLALAMGTFLAVGTEGRRAMGAPEDGPPAAKERPKEKRPDPVPPPSGPADTDFNLKDYTFTLDQAIQLFEERVKKNPMDFASLQYLGEFYERKAKETGDLALYAKAEAALRESLRLEPDVPRTEATLAAVLCTQHKFAEGLAIAQKLNRRNPRDIDALATMGDALLEMGRYPEAEEALRDLLTRSPLPQVVARKANVAELKGDFDGALRLMREAAEAIRKSGAPKDVAWYQGRLGDIAFNAGRLDEADAFYRSVPEGTDTFHDATFGKGRVLLAKGRADEAIEMFEKAVAIGPDPHMLAALGDLYLKHGRKEKAEALFSRLEEVTEGKAEYLRERSLFYSDHDRKLPEALSLAEKDLEQRKDVFGYDALAWALCKNGRPEEAAKAMEQAMKLGTKDSKLYYHSGMIALKLGDKDKAREQLRKALSQNPHFSALQAEEARRVLDSLGSGQQ